MRHLPVLGGVLLVALFGVVLTAGKYDGPGFYDVDGGEILGPEAVLVPCNPADETQLWEIPTPGVAGLIKMKDKNLCLSPERDGLDQFPVNADPCADSEKYFVYDSTTKRITHKNKDIGRCLQAAVPVDIVEPGTPVQFFQCRPNPNDANTPASEQMWNFQNNMLSTVLNDQMCLSIGHRFKDWQQGCQNGGRGTPLPYCTTSLPIAERVKDLLSHLNLQEKIDQLQHSAPAVPKISLPAYNWWSESLHGVYSHRDAADHPPTTFPAPINLGATFDKQLFTEIGVAISDEVRAIHHSGVQAALSTQFGLNVFSPNINIVRDPRWGRVQETPGEDPKLSGVYARNYIQAVQGNDPKYIKVVAVPKHFAVHSLDATPPVGDRTPYQPAPDIQRWQFDAVATQQDIYQTYLPAFKMAVVEGKAKGIMCAYNEINGIPACANKWLLNETLRVNWGFDGFVTGDCNAVRQIFVGHHYNSSEEAAAAEALNAGVDNDCHVGDVAYRDHLMDAINKKMTTEKQIDVSLTRLFTLRMQLGMFDPVEKVPWAQISPSVVDSVQHRALALKAARESIVLLKNVPASGGAPVLPLGPKMINREVLGPNGGNPLKVALIGYFANATDKLASVYTGELPKVVSIEEALKANPRLNVTTVLGVPSEGVKLMSTEALMSAAVDAASKAEVAILCMGQDRTAEREGIDRVTIDWRGSQADLIARVLAVQPNTVLVVITGGSIDLTTQKATVPAILVAFQPGEEGGTAIADVLTGVYNPSGRLPITFYPRSFTEVNDWNNHDMRAVDGKTYRFYRGTAVYEFGDGMSYTTFSYKIVSHDSEMSRKKPANIVVAVSNTGSRDGDVSVPVYLVSTDATKFGCPLRQLADFQRAFVPAGQTVRLTFQVNPLDALCFNSTGGQVDGEKFKVVAGGSLGRAGADQVEVSTFEDVEEAPVHINENPVLSSGGIFGVFLAITVAVLILVFLARLCCPFAAAKEYKLPA